MNGWNPDGWKQANDMPTVVRTQSVNGNGPDAESINTTAMPDGDDGRQLVCADCAYGT